MNTLINVEGIFFIGINSFETFKEIVLQSNEVLSSQREKFGESLRIVKGSKLLLSRFRSCLFAFGLFFRIIVITAKTIIITTSSSSKECFNDSQLHQFTLVVDELHSKLLCQLIQNAVS